MIRIRLLGTAAGGGFPQWNCGCHGCTLARTGKSSRRTQSCVAVSGADGKWGLINASPDFPAQVERLGEARPECGRSNPVDAVLLTNADLDHVLGLIAMREGGELRVCATPAVRRTLTEAWPLDDLLGAFCGIEWCAPEEFSATFETHAIVLPGGPPPYARGLGSEETGHSIACELHNPVTGKRAVIAPDVACVTGELHEALQRADAVLFDGTFWTDDELQHIKPGARTARQMGHLPICEGSLELLRALPAAHKSYLHVNNTNPILIPGSPERAALEAAGIAVEEDGTEWTL